MSMFRLPRPIPGGPQLAREQDEIVRALEAARNLEVDGPSSIDVQTAGARITNLPRVVLGLWEITATWENTEVCGSSSAPAPSSSGTVTDFPDDYGRVLARPVLYYTSTAAWERVANANSREEYIFHPGGYPPLERDLMLAEKLFLPRYNLGDRVWAVWHNDTGWWEIIQDYEDIWRFELATDLVIGGTADAYPRMWDASAGSSSAGGGGGGWVTCREFTIELFDHMALFEGVTGALGLCKYFADALHWEILIMGCP